MRKKKVTPRNNLAIVIMIVLMAAAALFVFSKLYFTEERMVGWELDSLAKAYYEGYLYDEYATNSKLGAEKVLSPFSRVGFGKTFLRQLLIFDENHGGNSRDKLNEKCDSNQTYVMYYPKSPYGKTDYDFKYIRSCNFD